MRSGYSNFSWFVRAARVAPVIAGAALLGGIIGGFAMFAIDSALTWGPSTQPRLDVRAESETPVLNQQPTKPVRIVGGAIPDPSAGMSAPPPVQQPQQSQQSGATVTQSAAQISSALFTPSPLGPASPLQRQTATTAAGSTTPPQSQTANQLPVPTPNATPNAAPSGASASQQTRSPDALSRAHQNAANAQQQTGPAAPPAAIAPPAQSSDRAASIDDQGRIDSWRHGRHSRRHAWRYGGDDEAAGAAASSRRQQARSYDRLYDSYGNRRDRSYGNARQQFSGDRDDQSGGAPPFEGARSRPEPFWGGGGFRRGYQNDY